MSIPHLVHEVLAVLDHELDGGVLELLSVVEVGQDEALQARVHGEVVAQGLLVKLYMVVQICFFSALLADKNTTGGTKYYSRLETHFADFLEL